MKKLILFALLFTLLTYSSCATSSAGKETVQPVKKKNLNLVLKYATTGNEVETVQQAAYGQNPDLKNIEADLQKGLEKYPGNAALHEIAALISLLESDSDSVFDHLLQASFDLNSPDTLLYLSLINSMQLTADEKTVFIKALETISSEHKNEQVIQFARNILSGLYLMNDDPEKARFEADSNRYIRKWMVIGSFDNDNGKGFYEEFPPEKELDFAKKYKGKVVDVGWRRIYSKENRGSIPLGSLFSPSSDALAYLSTTIFAPSDKEIMLNISTGDSLKVWLNGKNIFSDENIEYYGIDNVIIKTKLLKGENVIVLKSCQKSGTWNISARITDVSGKVPTDLVSKYKALNSNNGNDLNASVIMPVEQEAPLSINFREGLIKFLILREKGYEKYSRNYIQTIFNKNPTNMFAMFFMAGSLEVSKEEGKYIDLLKTAIEKYPDLGMFYILRGDFFSRKDQKENAEEDLKKALELNPGSIDAYKSLSGLYQSKGWLEDSRRTIETALKKNPSSFSLLLNMASIMNKLGYREDSEKYYRKALKLSPGNSFVHDELYNIAQLKQDYRSAIYFAEKSLRLYPYMTKGYFQLFDIYKSQKDFANARVQLNKIKKFMPENSSVYSKSGDLYYESGDNTAALKEWEKAHELDPHNSYVSERISFVKVEEKDFAESLVPDENMIMDMIKRSGSITPDDGAETLLVYDHAICKINSDGSSKWFVTEVNKALNDAGRDSMISSFLPYDGRKKILKAYAVSSDMKKTEASSVSAYEIKFRQLNKGDYTVVQYVHYKPAPVFLENYFVENWYVQSPMRHVFYSEWNLLYPKDKKISIDIIGNRIRQVVDTSGEFISHKFIAENIEPINYEPNSPPIENFLETVTVSTSDNWDLYVNWEKALLKDAFATGREVKEKAEKLTKDETTTLGKINKIFSFVAQEIRYQQEYENTIAGVKPHTAAQTLERGYGDCKDKAVLFIQLAKEISLNVDYVILRTKDAGRFQKKIPNQQFNHAIVYIPKQDGIQEGFFMDPTVDLLEIGSLRQDDQGATALKLVPETGKYEFMEIPYQSPDFNYQRHERTYSFSENGKLTVNDFITMKGGISSSFRQVLRTKDTGNKMFQRIANTLFKGGVLEKYDHSDIEDISKPFTINYSADVTNLVSQTDNKIIISLPEQIVNSSIISMEKRLLPLWTGVPSNYEINVKFKIPEGTKIDSAPSSFEIKTGCMLISRQVGITSSEVEIKSVFTNSCIEISTSDYAEFRKNILEVVKKQNEYLVFIKK
ncbi:MAG TPA: transglutaminase domain-containing protein [bacterium]|nr:transglutaminase domain-containing protein [bacterium]